MWKSLLLVVVVACGGGAAHKPPIDNTTPVPAANADAYTLAVVMSGWEVWIGNDKLAELAPEDPSRARGVLLDLAAAFDKLDLAHTAPAGSMAMVVTFADKAAIRLPLSPIASFNGAVLGTQKDYYGTAGTELVRGVTLALDQIAKAPTKRKYLLVLSDGNDTNNQEAAKELPKLKAQAAQDGIVIYALTYRTVLSPAGNMAPMLTDNAKVVPTSDAIAADLAHIFERLGK
ncbi:MAG: vWA domain-containing protein [Kofleriaceae bacterium]